MGEITVEDVRLRIKNRMSTGETSGQFKYPPRIEHAQTQKEFPFFVLWKHVEESHPPSSDGSEESQQLNIED